MRRAFVGFSTPIGYNYDITGNAEDLPGPPPIIVGTTGLLVLYDEIWFADRTLCPSSMQPLPYVRFLNEVFPDEAIELNARMNEILQQHHSGPELNSVTDCGSYGDFIRRFHGEGRFDYHSVHVDFYGQSVSGKPMIERFILDLLTIDHFDRLQLDPTFNTLTCRMCGPSPYQYLEQRDASDQARLAEMTLRIPNLHDFTGNEGPYHPVIESLREHDFIQAFRSWAASSTDRRDNQTIEEIADELNRRTDEFEYRLRRASLDEGSLRKVAISSLKSATLGTVEGAQAVYESLNLLENIRRRQDKKLFVFNAEAQVALRNVRPSKP